MNFLLKYISEGHFPYIYGFIVFSFVFLGGVISGLGGSVQTNLIFGLIMGLAAFFAIKIILKFGK
ncbi:component of SufBCD complex [Rhodobacteraceae bacterium HTCC2150]|nr:component of SufBCD complex [Rhodobacteraceae bacterium HTCC2150]